jgi:LPS-assembly lipoprotein
MSLSDKGLQRPCRRRALLAGAVAALAGCTLRPLYGTAPTGEAQRRVALGGVSGREGYLFREALARRFTLDPEARDQLDVTLTLNTVGLAISRVGDITRVNVEGLARYRLTDRQGERPPLEGTVRAISGYSTLASAYATRVAADDAVERVSAELAERVFTQVAVRSAAAGA